MDWDAIHLNDYEELVLKVVGAEAKVDLQPSFYMQETG